eukprot:1148390-Pelagomonas_calceolata.AAC.3
MLPQNSGPSPHSPPTPSLLSHCPATPSAPCPAAASPPQQQSGLCLAMLQSSPSAHLWPCPGQRPYTTAAAAAAAAAAAPAPPHPPHTMLLLAFLTCFSTYCSHTQAFFLPFPFSPFLGSTVLRPVGGGAIRLLGAGMQTLPEHSLHI